MKRFLMAALLAASAHASGDDIEWVTVGDPGNPPDKTGYGAVAYEFQISKFEISVKQYADFLNSVAANDPHQLWYGARKINRVGSPGAFRYEVESGEENKPVTFISFPDAMRFANWKHNGSGKADTETGVYDIAKHGGLAPKAEGAKVWIPSEDEWYKAAYYQPESKGGPEGGYWLYPTKSSEPPAFRELGVDQGNSARFENFKIRDKIDGGAGKFIFFPCGSYPNSASYYGTFDQGGNLWEWNAGIVFETKRAMRGGSGAHSVEKLRSTVRSNASPQKRYPDTGFRLARAVPVNVPEVSASEVTK
jgi:formylglycine-generating enzyme required for sulfatase activity